MAALLLFLIVIWIVLAILGIVLKGLFWLFIVGCVLVVLTLVTLGFTRGRSRRGPAR